MSTIFDTDTIPKASHLRDEKAIDAIRGLATDYGHKLVKTDIKTDEKDKRTLVLTFERSVSGQEEMALSAEREADDVPSPAESEEEG